MVYLLDLSSIADATDQLSSQLDRRARGDYDESEDEGEGLQQPCNPIIASSQPVSSSTYNCSQLTKARPAMLSVCQGQLRFSRAYILFSVAIELASHLDLNDLYSLAATCRSFHETMQALQCSSEARLTPMSQRRSARTTDLREGYDSTMQEVQQASLSCELCHSYSARN
ncbi:hypothetical protein MRB53_041875 [Persea americana]|nr:hypothetical protein MRB53_041875 [Persea americana]